MTPKQSESENTGGKRINKSIGQKEKGGEGKKRGEGKMSCFSILVVFQFV